MAVEIRDDDMLPELDGAGRLSEIESVLAPQRRSGAAIERPDVALLVGDVEQALSRADSGVRRHFASPQPPAGRQVEGGDTPLIGDHVHDAVHDDRVRVDVGKPFQLGASGGGGDLGFPDKAPVLERYRSEMAAVEPGDHEVAGDHRSAGASQRQGRHRAVVDPASLPAPGVETEELAVDGAYDDDSRADRRRRQHLARHLRAPCLRAVRVGECNHVAATASGHDETGSGAGPPGNWNSGVDCPELFSGERVICRDVALVPGREHPASGHGGAKLKTQSALSGCGLPAPERVDFDCRLDTFEFRRRRCILRVAPQEFGDGAAARQGEHGEERAESRERRGADRVVDLVRVAHRGTAHVSRMEGM